MNCVLCGHVTGSEKEAESEDEGGKSDEPVKSNVAKVTRPQGRLLNIFLFLYIPFSNSLWHCVLSVLCLVVL